MLALVRQVPRLCLLMGTASLLGCGLTLDTATPSEAGTLDGGVTDGGTLDGTLPPDTGVVDASSDTGELECATNTDCDDGDFCSGFEQCVGGECVGGDAPSCDDGIECTRDSCEGDGCLNDAKDDRCVGEPGEVLVCSPVDGCIVPDECEEDIDCNDGAFCNGEERCVAGFCEFGPAPACPSTGCMVGDCDEGEDRCVVFPDDSLCDDSIDCTRDSCGSAGACILTPVDSACDDGVHCTMDVCRTDGCDVVPLNSLCDDGVGCTRDRCNPLSDFADGEGCVGVPDDRFCSTVGGPTLQCATSVCVSGVDGVGGSTGCALDFDSSLCEVGTICSFEGACVAPMIGCTSDLGCNDGNPCNGIERCTTSGGGGGRCVKTTTGCPDTGDPCIESYCSIDPAGSTAMCSERPSSDCFVSLAPGP